MKKVFLSFLITTSAAVSVNASQTVTFLKEPVQIAGNALKTGQEAPIVELVNSRLKSVQVGGNQGKTQVIATVVSLNTPVCNAETIRLNEMAKRYPKVEFTVVSKDLPFEAAKFKKQHSLGNIHFASDYRSNNFGKLYGTYIESSVLTGLNNRVVYIINKNGKVAYQQVVSEIATPPNYKELENSLKHVI